MSDERAKREGIERAAKDFRESVERSGGSMTYDQARERVSEAVRKGDLKRSDNHR